MVDSTITHMFHTSVDQRITNWIECRKQLDKNDNPLQIVWDYWHQSPFVPYNKNVDPFYQKGWPSPWEILAENKYDDFTRALMIAWTLKLTNKFSDSKIEIKTLVDTINERQYNLVFVNDEWVINYDDNGPISSKDLNGPFRLENLIEVNRPR